MACDGVSILYAPDIHTPCPQWKNAFKSGNLEYLGQMRNIGYFFNPGNNLRPARLRLFFSYAPAKSDGDSFVRPFLSAELRQNPRGGACGDPHPFVTIGFCVASKVPLQAVPFPGWLPILPPISLHPRVEPVPTDRINSEVCATLPFLIPTDCSKSFLTHCTPDP